MVEFAKVKVIREVMPDYFLALIKQEANLTSQTEAERSAKAIVNSLDNTVDARIMEGVISVLPDYLKPKKHKFLARRNYQLKSFNQTIFFDRLVINLGLTDIEEAKFRFGAFMKALYILKPEAQSRLVKILPSDLNTYGGKYQ